MKAAQASLHLERAQAHVIVYIVRANPGGAQAAAELDEPPPAHRGGEEHR